MVLSHVMRGRPSCLLQSTGAEANRILLASALLSMRIICPNKVSRRDWMIAVSLGCFVSLRTSSFRTNWYHLMPSSIRRHHWSSASILRASILDIAQQSEPSHYPYAQNSVTIHSHFINILNRQLPWKSLKHARIKAEAVQWYYNKLVGEIIVTVQMQMIQSTYLWVILPKRFYNTSSKAT